MPVLLTFLLRLLLVATGLVFAASLAVAAALMLALWGARALWAKLTGRPVIPFVVRVGPLGGWDRVYRSRRAAMRPGVDAGPRAPRAMADIADVTDVEPKAPAKPPLT